jgi:hypothetical protein
VPWLGWQTLLALLRTGAAEVSAMFAAARLFEPVLELCFRLKFNNLLHNITLQVICATVAETGRLLRRWWLRSTRECPRFRHPPRPNSDGGLTPLATAQLVMTALHEVPDNLELARSVIIDCGGWQDSPPRPPLPSAASVMNGTGGATIDSD